jgi:hypothetical protein
MPHRPTAGPSLQAGLVLASATLFLLLVGTIYFNSGEPSHPFFDRQEDIDKSRSPSPPLSPQSPDTGNGSSSASSSSRAARLSNLVPWISSADSDPLPPWHGLHNDLEALARTVAADPVRDSSAGEPAGPKTVTVFPFNAKFSKCASSDSNFFSFIYFLSATH